jgi:hypothetical protein
MTEYAMDSIPSGLLAGTPSCDNYYFPWNSHS